MNASEDRDGDDAWEKMKAKSAAWRQEEAERIARIEQLFQRSPAIRGMSRPDGGEPRMAIKSGEISDPQEGRYRVTFFGSDGPHGHVTRDTDRAIAEAAADTLYPPIESMEDAEVIAWTSTEEYEKGALTTTFVQAENTLRWFAQKAGRGPWAQEIIARANDVGTRGGTVNSRGKPYSRADLEAAIDIVHAAIRDLPSPNPRRRHLVANPPWVTGALADSYETLEDKVPPRWMPELASVTSRGNILSAKFIEYGCGAYGCVLPTLDPKVVLKVTTDDSEAQFAAEIAHDLVAPIVVEYTMVVSMNRFHEGRQIHLLWREAADQVGKIGEALGGEKGRYALQLIADQHQAAQIAFKAVYDHQSAVMVRARVSFWLEMCERMATQVKVPELRPLGAGLVEVYERQRILFGDIHAGNLGLVTRAGKKSWVITDPGNITYVEERNPMSYHREHIPGGLAAGRSPREFDPVELAKGTKVELEHTPEPRVAREIAMDHLVEDPLYYRKLARIHRER